MIKELAIEIDSGTLFVQDDIMWLRIKRDVEVDVNHAMEGLEIRKKFKSAFSPCADSNEAFNPFSYFTYINGSC